MYVYVKLFPTIPQRNLKNYFLLGLKHFGWLLPQLLEEVDYWEAQHSTHFVNYGKTLIFLFVFFDLSAIGLYLL